MYFDTTMAGFGGQGIMLIGNLFAYSAMEEGREVTYMPTYGVEMRGGTANCTVVVSDTVIGSPIIGHPMTVIAMNRPSLTRYGPTVVEGGLVVINESLVPDSVEGRPDLRQVRVPANEIAQKLGNDKMANMVVLGAFLELVKVVRLDSVFDSFSHVLDERYHRLIPKNIEMIKAGIEFITTNGGKP
jgi:2-oxoglutarate ferredoxin oxidoreductase subunit gamma